MAAVSLITHCTLCLAFKGALLPWEILLLPLGKGQPAEASGAHWLAGNLLLRVHTQPLHLAHLYSLQPRTIHLLDSA